MKYIASIAAIVCLLFVSAAPASAQHVKTYKSNFPNFCPNPGPTAY